MARNPESGDFEEVQLSIVIPTFNCRRFLTKTLSRLLAQDWPGLEIVVVNDGSTDGTKEYLSDVGPHFFHLTSINQAHEGLSSARNTGLAAAKGNYGVFLDADDYIDLAVLRSQILDSATDNALDIAFFDTVPFLDGGNPSALERMQRYYSRTNAFHSDNHLKDSALIAHMVDSGGLLVSSCLYLWRRELVQSCGLTFSEGRIMEDNLFTFKLLSVSKRVQYFNSFPHRRRVRTDSLSQSASKWSRTVGYLDAMLGGLALVFRNRLRMTPWQRKLLVGFGKSALKNLIWQLGSLRLRSEKEADVG